MITENDILLFDIITYSVHSFALIKDINDELLSGNKNPITQYYLDWCKKRLPEGAPYPFNPGIIWMYTSAILVNCKRWLNFLPKTKISMSDPKKWGLKTAELRFPKDQDPSIKRTVRKMRNAISHSNIDLITGSKEAPWDAYLEETKFIFRGKDDFELKISVPNLARLNAAIYETIDEALKPHRKRLGFE